MTEHAVGIASSANSFASIVPIREEATQGTFEGFPLQPMRFSLTQTKELPCNVDVLHPEQLVSGTFTGRVKGRHERREGKAFGSDAKYTRCWEVEVYSAELDG